MTWPLIFSCAFVFAVRLSNKILPSFLSRFRLAGCYENVTTFQFGLPASAQFSRGNFALIRLCGFCNEIIMTFHFCFLASAKVFQQYCLNSLKQVVTISLQLFWLKNRLLKAWHGHVLGSGFIKLTANRRQLSPISLKRGRKQAKLPDPLWDEGHYRIGFRRPSQDWRIRRFRPASKNQSHSRIKMQVRQNKNRRSAVVLRDWVRKRKAASKI
jgi:hypothetical protein